MAGLELPKYLGDMVKKGVGKEMQDDVSPTVERVPDNEGKP